MRAACLCCVCLYVALACAVSVSMCLLLVLCLSLCGSCLCCVCLDASLACLLMNSHSVCARTHTLAWSPLSVEFRPGCRRALNRLWNRSIVPAALQLLQTPPQAATTRRMQHPPTTLYRDVGNCQDTSGCAIGKARHIVKCSSVNTWCAQPSRCRLSDRSARPLRHRQ